MERDADVVVVGPGIVALSGTRPCSPADAGRRRPPAPRAELGPKRRRRRLVDLDGLAREHDPVVLARRAQAHELVPHVASHAQRIALEGIAPAARPRRLVTEDVAAL